MGTELPVEHRADAVFALPRIPRTVAVFGDPPGWREDLEQLGIGIVSSADSAQLIAADDQRAAEALAVGGEDVIVDGSPKVHERFQASGLATRRLMPLPMMGSPVLFVDLKQRRAARYGVEQGIVHPERWRIVRNRVAALLVGAGALPGVRATVTVGSRSPGPPALLSAARDLGAREDAAWVMFVAAGSVVRRNAFLLFPPGSSSPEHVLKFARVRDLALPFERDERGAELAARTGGAVSAHAPSYLGRLRLDGYEGSLETAAVGTKLNNLLRRPVSRRRKLEAVERVARWLVQVARETAAPPQALEAERQRLAREVPSSWPEAGIPADFVESLPPVPASFQHNDVAEDNVIVGRAGFTVLDWEWAQPHGVPIGDLIYFAVHVLRIVDGALTAQERDRHFVDVLSGRARSSPILFRWVRELVRALDLPAEAVGPIATLNWLDRGRLSRQERFRAESVGGVKLGEAFAERAARLWISEPSLGAGWHAWRA